MKKILLTAMALLAMASTSVFGMYGDQDDWIDFLTDGNQFRARMDQLGFVLGNSTITDIIRIIIPLLIQVICIENSVATFPIIIIDK